MQILARSKPSDFAARVAAVRAPGRVQVPTPSARFRLMEHNPTPLVSLSSPARTRLASRPLLLSHG